MIIMWLYKEWSVDDMAQLKRRTHNTLKGKK